MLIILLFQLYIWKKNENQILKIKSKIEKETIHEMFLKYLDFEEFA